MLASGCPGMHGDDRVLAGRAGDAWAGGAAGAARRAARWLRRRGEAIEHRLRFRTPHGRCPEYARWRRREGLDPFRAAWWPQARLEGYATVRRYALLLDHAVAAIRSRPRGGLLPAGARMVVFRMGHLGDLLHLMPAIREVRRQRPDVRLELVTGPWNQALTARFDEWDAIHFYVPDVLQFHRGDRRGVCSPREERNLIERLRGDGVNVVFCPERPHFAVLPFLVGLNPDYYVGVPWPLPGVPAGAECRCRPFDSRHYEMEAVGEFLPLLGLERATLSLYCPITDDSRRRVRRLLGPRGSAGQRLVVLFPGSGWPGKSWPAPRFAELGDRIAQAGPFRLAVAGSPGEKQLCQSVVDAMQPSALNLAGLLSIDESAALIESAALVVTNDSAPLHLAAALQVPSVSLWGPTFREKWAPPTGMDRAVVTPLRCAGCAYWHAAATCTGEPPCMTGITVQQAWEAVQDVLSQTRTTVPMNTD